MFVRGRISSLYGPGTAVPAPSFTGFFAFASALRSGRFLKRAPALKVCHADRSASFVYRTVLRDG